MVRAKGFGVVKGKKDERKILRSASSNIHHLEPNLNPNTPNQGQKKKMQTINHLDQTKDKLLFPRGRSGVA